jgi:hypothetical protein
MSSQQVSGPCDSDVAGVFDTDGEFCSSWSFLQNQNYI